MTDQDQDSLASQPYFSLCAHARIIKWAGKEKKLARFSYRLPKNRVDQSVVTGKSMIFLLLLENGMSKML